MLRDAAETYQFFFVFFIFFSRLDGTPLPTTPSTDGMSAETYQLQTVSGRNGAIDWLPLMSTKIQQVYREAPRVIDMEPDSPEQHPPQGNLPSGDRNLLDEGIPWRTSTNLRSTKSL